MTNNKQELIDRLEKYAQSVKDRMGGGIPDKHNNRPAQYKQYLAREYANTIARIERLKLEEGK